MCGGEWGGRFPVGSSSLTRDGIHTSCSRSRVSTTWTTPEFPGKRVFKNQIEDFIWCVRCEKCVLILSSNGVIIQLVQTFESERRVLLMSVWTWTNWNCPRHIITLTCIYFLKGMNLKNRNLQQLLGHSIPLGLQ